MRSLKTLIREIRRRRLWQALSIYAIASWFVLQVVSTLGGALNLPTWFPSVALAMIIVGLPVVLATAFVQESALRRDTGDAKAAEAAPSSGVAGLLTWPKAFGGGVLAFALWGVVAAAWMVFAGGSRVDATAVVLSAISEVDDAMDRGAWLEAYGLVTSLPSQVPDSLRGAMLESVTSPRDVISDPSSASVSWRPYDRPDLAYEFIGTTPVAWQGPRSGVAFRIELEGHIPQVVGRGPGAVSTSVRLRRSSDVQAEALHVPGRAISPATVEARLGNSVPASLGEFLIDRYEVTNRQFKEFVDADGYRKPQYWTHPFEREGEELTYEEAIAQFVDLTGRLGPSTWTGGNFPSGSDDYPVVGLSWYEAAAYADFAGRTLPTVYHWSLAAGLMSAAFIVPFSNFGGEGLTSVGEFPAVSPVGAYDMAGNAREWLVNAVGNQRYTAGGGWNDPPYLFALTQPQSPFDRSETNGLRLMTNLGDPGAFAEASQPTEPEVRDFYSDTPASDELYAELVRFYEYEDTPLNAQVVEVDTLEVGIREKITFDVGYTQEPMVLYLFRPLESSGPLQTVVNYPGSGALSATDFDAFTREGTREPIPMVVRSNRAFAFPVYQSTFERQDDLVYRLQDTGNNYREHVLQWRQDLGRSLDYLETRPDIDSDRFAYLGMSWGGRTAGIMLAVEPRFRAAVLNVPGLSPLATQAVVDPFNFLPRVRLPVLMLSGEYDQVYPLETSARAFFDFLGTDEGDKKHFVAAGGHLIPQIDLTRETLNWLDRYLGEVR